MMEPAEAVFGGRDGFELIRGLLDQSGAQLAPGGRLLMEFGAGQDDEVRAIVATYPSLAIRAMRDDLQGIPRVAVIDRREGATDGAKDSGETR